MQTICRRISVFAATARFLLPLLALAAFPLHGIAQSPPPATVAQAPLPARLSDALFWSFISDFSEPGGTFASENFTSNEFSIGQIATELRARGRTGGAYIGVGPEQNFTYIAALRPEVVFIVDIRRQAVMQHLMFKAVFELSANRSEFIGRLFSMPVQQQASEGATIAQIWDSYQTATPDTALFARNLAEINNHLTSVRRLGLSTDDLASLAHVYGAFFRLGPAISYRGFSQTGSVAQSLVTFGSLSLVTDNAGVDRGFLANEADFRFLKDLHTKNLFIPVVGDFGGPSAIRSVASWLKQHRTSVTAYYVSNVEDYLFRPADAWQRFYASVAALPLDSMSVFIRPAAGNPHRLTVDNTRFLRFAPPAPPAPARSFGLSMGRGGGPPPTPPTPPVVPAPQDPQLGAVVGVVKDSASGAVLARTMVQLAGTSFAATADDSGKFVIPNVTPGTYTVQARRVGYAPGTIPGIPVAIGPPATADVKLASQVLFLQGVVTTGAGTFTVAGLSGMESPPRPHVAICPIQEYLAAYAAGRVLTISDARACTR